MSERAPIQVFMDRIKFLIKTDENLTVGEVIGALHLIAHEVAACSLSDDDPEGDDG